MKQKKIKDVNINALKLKKNNEKWNLLLIIKLTNLIIENFNLH